MRTRKLGVFLAGFVAFAGADQAFAAKTTVTVTNATPYALDVIYKAVGCVKIVTDGVGVSTAEVCHVIEDVQPGETVAYEFGGGTSGRKAWAEIVSATCAGSSCSDDPQMMVSKDQLYIDNWNLIYINDEGVGHHAMIRDGYGVDRYMLADNGANSCAVEGFGILHDAHVTWTQLVIEGVNYVFEADCGVSVQQPAATFVSLGDCASRVRNRAIDESNLSLQQAVGTLANKCAARHGNRATGQVVSCIAQDLNNLVKDGVISGREKGALQSCAARARGKF